MLFVVSYRGKVNERSVSTNNRRRRPVNDVTKSPAFDTGPPSAGSAIRAHAAFG